MKSIIENAGYKAATVQLNELTTAHSAASAEQTVLLALLSDRPDSKPSALDRAKAMLTGGQAPQREDRDGLGLRLAACREKLALLNAAIQEQRGIMAGLVSAQSAIVNSERKADHIKAAKGIQFALAGLQIALDAEWKVRSEIADAGYSCTLETFQRPYLNFDDSQATISRFARDVDTYMMTNELTATKSVNVHLLFGTGDSLPGDVVAMTGHEAAALVRVGHGEPTSDKPSRVKRPVITSYGHALS